MYWFFGRKSKLSTSNKLLIYKIILKPICTYGTQLWDSASTSNIEILGFQSKALRMILDAPLYVPNTVIRRDLQTPTVIVETRLYSSQYSARLSAHPNGLVVNLMEQPDNKKWNVITKKKKNNFPSLSSPPELHTVWRHSSGDNTLSLHGWENCKPVYHPVCSFRKLGGSFVHCDVVIHHMVDILQTGGRSSWNRKRYELESCGPGSVPDVPLNQGGLKEISCYRDILTASVV
jgi:hypothetical protein